MTDFHEGVKIVLITSAPQTLEPVSWNNFATQEEMSVRGGS
ncbi:hypothetical protein [Bradyrhizobium pachyrhizi]|nr:hypothetical protein [Bradyrhizobium pachyrhizi]